MPNDSRKQKLDDVAVAPTILFRPDSLAISRGRPIKLRALESGHDAFVNLERSSQIV
jgi:hypothetical protein